MTPNSTSAPAEAALSVSQLNRRAKQLLESGLARLWVEGEISNIAKPASGHLYFSLKDESAQIRAAFFRQRQRGPTLGLKNGDKVLAFGRVSLYEPRGDYQLIVEQVEPAGEGALKREFDRLKKKLAAEGLFDDNLKQPLPTLPSRIGIVTSPSGAAVRDVLTVLKRRFPAVPVIIYPSAVQGDAAPAELERALGKAIDRNECNVLILCRGGGSLEDLWAFNNESLARAIAASPIPIISAVGHEVDFTIADFVADVRAPTPSGAAEIVVPDGSDWLRAIDAFGARVARLGRRAVEDRAQSLDWLTRQLLRSSPAGHVARQREQLATLRRRLESTMRQSLMVGHSALDSASVALLRLSPALAVERAMRHLGDLRGRLVAANETQHSALSHRLELAMRGLHSVSPLATLERGYAIVLDADGRAVTQASDLSVGDHINARLSQGSVVATVSKVVPGEPVDD